MLSIHCLIERFAFEKGKTRGGDTAPPGLKQVEKLRFFPLNARSYGLKREVFQTENAPEQIRFDFL